MRLSDMDLEEGAKLLNEIQNRIYNQTAVKKEIELYFNYIHYLELAAFEVAKIAPEVMKQVHINLSDQIQTESAETVPENAIIN